MIPILDAGHGGMINGIYQTAGKRSPDWAKGVLYEGMFNRWVVNRIIEKLDRLKISYYHISPELRDVSLRTRSARANKIMKVNPNTYLLSIHANAGGGYGIEGFTTRGVTGSDDIAELFLRNLENDLNTKFRFDFRDGDRDKESNFWMLRKPIGRAFLLECGFMDNSKDYMNLWDEDYLQKLVDSLVLSIIQLY